MATDCTVFWCNSLGFTIRLGSELNLTFHPLTNSRTKGSLIISVHLLRQESVLTLIVAICCYPSTAHSISKHVIVDCCLWVVGFLEPCLPLNGFFLPLAASKRNHVSVIFLHCWGRVFSKELGDAHSVPYLFNASQFLQDMKVLYLELLMARSFIYFFDGGSFPGSFS